MAPEIYAKITDDTEDNDAEYNANLPTAGDSGDQHEAHVGLAVTKAPRKRGMQGAKKRVIRSQPNSGAVDVEHLTPDLYHLITGDTEFYARLDWRRCVTER
jgi:hypothetical protein